MPPTWCRRLKKAWRVRKRRLTAVQRCKNCSSWCRTAIAGTVEVCNLRDEAAPASATARSAAAGTDRRGHLAAGCPDHAGAAPLGLAVLAAAGLGALADGGAGADPGAGAGRCVGAGPAGLGAVHMLGLAAMGGRAYCRGAGGSAAGMGWVARAVCAARCMEAGGGVALATASSCAADAGARRSVERWGAAGDCARPLRALHLVAGA